MKTNFSFSKKPHTSLLLATATLLLLSMQSTTFAGSAAWNDTGGGWNNNADWTPNTGFPNGAADTATFNLANTFTAVGISANTEVAGITFSNLATNPYTITVNPPRILTISGTGITNNDVGKSARIMSSLDLRFGQSKTVSGRTRIAMEVSALNQS